METDTMESDTLTGKGTTTTALAGIKPDNQQHDASWALKRPAREATAASAKGGLQSACRAATGRQRDAQWPTPID